VQEHRVSLLGSGHDPCTHRLLPCAFMRLCVAELCLDVRTVANVRHEVRAAPKGCSLTSSDSVDLWIGSTKSLDKLNQKPFA